MVGQKQSASRKNIVSGGRCISVGVILFLVVAFCAQLHVLLGEAIQAPRPPRVAQKDTPVVHLDQQSHASRVPTPKVQKPVRCKRLSSKKTHVVQRESFPKNGFRVGSKTIRVERFDPLTSDPHPTIVLVHGSAGLGVSGIYYRLAARAAAKKGFIVFLVHYLDRTGTKSVGKKELNRKNFLAWQETVREAVLYASRQKGVQRDRIGLMGCSLGGYLTMSVAMERNLPVRAVAEWFGGMPKEYYRQTKILPPTLIVHGECDKVVAVSEARRLARKLDELHVPHETRIYKGQRHLFRTDPFGKDAQDAQNATVRFFRKYLISPNHGAVSKTKHPSDPPVRVRGNLTWRPEIFPE